MVGSEVNLIWLEDLDQRSLSIIECSIKYDNVDGDAIMSGGRGHKRVNFLMIYSLLYRLFLEKKHAWRWLKGRGERKEKCCLMKSNVSQSV